MLSCGAKTGNGTDTQENGGKQLKTVTKRDTLGMAGKMKAVTSARHCGGKPLQAMRRGAL